MNYDFAPRELRIQMALVDRKFYADRLIGIDACKALINDAIRLEKRCKRKPGNRGANRSRKLKATGRRLV